MLERSGGWGPRLASMMRAGWFVVPDENHPRVKAQIAKHAESICQAIDERILKEFNSR